MVSCSTFASDVDCVLNYTNEFNVKLVLLLFIFGYIVFSIWYSKDLDLSDSYSDLLKYISFNLFPKVLLIFFPFFLLMLKTSVSLEIIINTLVIFYLIIVGLSIGLGIFKGKDYIVSLMGDRRDISTKFKYMKN